jgi:replicative DNA helicase
VLSLKPEDFHRDKNRWTYEACLALYDRNESVNQITVASELRRRERLEAAGGSAFLSDLISRTPTSVGIESYAQNVNRLSTMRNLISAANQIAAIGYEAPPSVEAALDQAEGILFQLRHGQRTRDFIPLRQVFDRYFEESTLAPRARDGFLPHIPTGFTDIDKILGGMQRSDMVVVAARPSVGKTSLALNIARNAALDHGARVALFSLEMSSMELAYRFLSSESGVDTQRVRLDQLSDGQRYDITEAMGLLAEAPIYIDDSPYLRDSDMKSKARRLHNEKKIDLIVVDYIQLMHSARRSDNRVQEMSEISSSIKELARDLDVPILAVSQLSRAVEARTPHTPLLSDLRDSGTIEQDADVVLFIYRDDVYYTEEEWKRRFPDKDYPKGVADIIIAKHRNGPTGRLNLYFRERMAKFENMERRKDKPSLL